MAFDTSLDLSCTMLPLCPFKFPVLFFLLQWISVPFAMTHPAVSSISVDSKEWVGELSVKQLGPWMDYALLLVNTDFVSDLIFLTT